jgi:ribosomal protein L11 methyltransferase
VRAVVVTVAPAEVELASDVLWALGVVAIEERVDPITGEVELWTSLGDELDPRELEGVRWPWRFESVDESVSETWREHATPTWVAEDLVVNPAWLPRREFAGALVIDIEPGATFGLGDHPTTVLSLLALRRAVREGTRVLDVGCGSGVLAVGACRFGAAHADAIDISPAAVPTTRDNAARNGVAERIAASTTPLAEVDGTYDVVVANILAPVLVDLAADLRRVLAAGGTLIISGILASRHDHVLAALAPLRPVATAERDGWCAISLRG